MIGITVSSRASEEERRSYRDAVESVRAKVVLLCPSQQEVQLQRLDGLLLGGGGDVDPSFYGQEQHQETRNVDKARDQRELQAARQALALALPMLGICRGAQVLGVALGGDLVQDIASLVQGAREHASRPHEVTVHKSSRLASILGCTRLQVNSSHHQAIRSPGDRLQKVAWSDDEIIEGIEAAGHPFALAIQWHPERMLADDKQIRLFEAFVGASTQYAGVKRR